MTETRVEIPENFDFGSYINNYGGKKITTYYRPHTESCKKVFVKFLDVCSLQKSANHFQSKLIDVPSTKLRKQPSTLRNTKPH